MKNIFVDMSCTLIHHGHVRLLKKAAELGRVTVGLTSDLEIFKKKGYTPELSFVQRREILESIRWVDHVVETPWLITDDILKEHHVDVLVHGSDNSNIVGDDFELVLIDRTPDISSTVIRDRVLTARAPRKILLNPGPCTTTNTVKLAQVVTDICPRIPEFSDLTRSINKKILDLYGVSSTHSCVLFGSSGTGSVESVISSISGTAQHSLIINNGAYGQRMCEIADAYGLHYTQYKCDQFKPLDLSDLSVVCRRLNIDTLCVVHCETTTGLLNDIYGMVKLCKEHGIKIVVDAMSSFGALSIPVGDIDYTCASSNKNIQGLPGVSFVIARTASIELLKNAPTRNFYFDLYKQYDNFNRTGQFRFTPPVQTIYAFNQALDELYNETLLSRKQRYALNHQTLISGLEKLNVEYWPTREVSSGIITLVKLPQNIQFKTLFDYFNDLDITIYPSTVGDEWFRVANIGDLQPNDLQRFVDLFAQFICKT